MSYLGKVDMNDANIKHYSLTGSTLTTVDIGWVPPSEQSLRVTINGVVQQGGSFSLSGSNLTLGGPLVATDDLEVIGIQSVGSIITPADNSVTTAKLADDAVTTVKINDDAVTTDKILDNNVTLAKMAGGTDGNLITYDASGDPAYVATGAATNVLTSNGPDTAPTFQAAAGGGSLVFLAENVISAEVTEVAFDDIFSATYRNYRFYFNNVLPAATNNSMYMGVRATTDGSLLATNYLCTAEGVTASSTTVSRVTNVFGAAQTEIFHPATDDGGINGWVEVINPFQSGAADWTRMQWMLNGYGYASSGWMIMWGASQTQATTSCAHMKMFAGGTHTGDASIDGYIRAYGIKES